MFLRVAKRFIQLEVTVVISLIAITLISAFLLPWTLETKLELIDPMNRVDFEQLQHKSTVTDKLILALDGRTLTHTVPSAFFSFPEPTQLSKELNDLKKAGVAMTRRAFGLEISLLLITSCLAMAISAFFLNRRFPLPEGVQGAIPESGVQRK